MLDELFQIKTKKKGLLELISDADRKVYLDPPLRITEEMAQVNPMYSWLYDAYNSSDDVPIEKRMAISFINHKITNNKVAVRISQKVLEKLTLDDENWKDKKPFTEKSYNASCAILSEMNIKRIAWATRQRPAILYSFPGSPTYEHYTGNIEEDLRQIFKQNKTIADDFKVPEYQELFKRYLDQ